MNSILAARHSEQAASPMLAIAIIRTLKARIHRELLNRLNLERLNRVAREEAEPEIRGLIIGLMDTKRGRRRSA